MENPSEPSLSQSLKELFSIKSIPFLAMHLGVFLAFFTGVSIWAIILCVVMYYLRMLVITSGYHRYFSHRSFKTSRTFQFILAFLGCTALQKGPLWWAAHHRTHHRYTDQTGDIHSPRQNGFWWAHMGWLLSNRYNDTNWDRIKDFASYPELRWLNRWYLVPPLALVGLCFLLLGWQGIVWGFIISTVLLYHGTFTVNSLSHMFGSRRFATADDSRNNFWLALITCGEGWHNNHHAQMTSVKQGFYWWEIDFSYYLLKVLSWFKIVWDLRMPKLTLIRST